MDRRIGIWMFFAASVCLLAYALLGAHGDEAPARSYAATATAPVTLSVRAAPRPPDTARVPSQAVPASTGAAARPAAPVLAPENDAESDDCSAVPPPPGCEPESPPQPDGSDDSSE